jgi:2-C-methyl-D-erythritol 4-phosphate cytidylyltransferase
MNLGVIIAAGGVGSRMSAGSSKQMLELAGMPVVARSVAIFQPLPAVAEMVIAIGEADILRCRVEVVDRHGFTKVTAVVAGGENRARSVRNALAALSPGVDTVAIHDGARPLFPPELLDTGLRELTADYDGVVFGVPVIDTVKEADPDSHLIISTPDRSRLWSAQTPQIFRRRIIEKAFEAPREIIDQATDDASLVERAGGRVKMVTGSRENIKITEPLDLLTAAEIFKRRGAE